MTLEGFVERPLDEMSNGESILITRARRGPGDTDLAGCPAVCLKAPDTPQMWLVSVPEGWMTVTPDVIKGHRELIGIQVADAEEIAESGLGYQGLGALLSDALYDREERLEAQAAEKRLRPIAPDLPAHGPSPLDQAVTCVKDIEGGPMVESDSPPAERLSLLLDALASVQGATRKAVPLALVARICVDWVLADKPGAAALAQMRSRAESLPEDSDSDAARFLVLAGIVGEMVPMLSGSGTDADDGLINAGAYALAWITHYLNGESK